MHIIYKFDNYKFQLIFQDWRSK